MRITAELSLYPLDGDPIPTIVAFIESLADRHDIELVVNQMSTQLRGELDAVVACVHDAIRQSFSSGASQVLVAKFLNADLSIMEPPDLEPRG